jgi:hypothetical protein
LRRLYQLHLGPVYSAGGNNETIFGTNKRLISPTRTRPSVPSSVYSFGKLRETVPSVRRPQDNGTIYELTPPPFLRVERGPNPFCTGFTGAYCPYEHCGGVVIDLTARDCLRGWRRLFFGHRLLAGAAHVRRWRLDYEYRSPVHRHSRPAGCERIGFSLRPIHPDHYFSDGLLAPHGRFHFLKPAARRSITGDMEIAQHLTFWNVGRGCVSQFPGKPRSENRVSQLSVCLPLCYRRENTFVTQFQSLAATDFVSV